MMACARNLLRPCRERVQNVHDEGVTLLPRNPNKIVRSGIFINQSKYCFDLFKRFGMESFKESITPMATLCYLDPNEKGKNIEESRYIWYVDSLIHLIASHPDIMHSIYVCACWTIEVDGWQHG